MVITVEPGLYFIDFIIEASKKQDISKFLNYELIEEYKYIGGVRIEDDVVVQKDGARILGGDLLPRTVEDIENFMQKKKD